MITKKAVMSKPRAAARLKTVTEPVSDSTVFTQYIGVLEVKPRQQSRMSLGLFDKKAPPKGFSVTLSPEPENPGTVISHINTPLGRMDTYELTLQITNYGTEKVNAEVWQMQ